MNHVSNLNNEFGGDLENYLKEASLKYELITPNYMKRRDAREAEGARLEIVYSANNGIEGSNPSLSATNHVGFVAALNST